MFTSCTGYCFPLSVGFVFTFFWRGGREGEQFRPVCNGRFRFRQLMLAANMQVEMGIHGLSKFLGDQCPHVLRETKLENHFGRKIGLDASMAMYQFLVPHPHTATYPPDPGPPVRLADSHKIQFGSTTLAFPI